MVSSGSQFLLNFAAAPENKKHGTFFLIFPGPKVGGDLEPSTGHLVFGTEVRPTEGGEGNRLRLLVTSPEAGDG